MPGAKLNNPGPASAPLGSSMKQPNMRWPFWITTMRVPLVDQPPPTPDLLIKTMVVLQAVTTSNNW